MVPQARPLIEALTGLSAFRSHHGKRHPLGATLACRAMLCGYRQEGYSDRCRGTPWRYIGIVTERQNSNRNAINVERENL